MKLVPKQGICSVSYVDIDPDDKFDHNLLICNGCLHWYQVYNRCNYHPPGSTLIENEYLEREKCLTAQEMNECPHKFYIRYYDKNYKFFIKNEKDEEYLKSKRKYDNINMKINSYYLHSF